MTPRDTGGAPPVKIPQECRKGPLVTPRVHKKGPTSEVQI